MKRTKHIVWIAWLSLAMMVSVAGADFQVTFDFETGWSGDYTPGWENSAYRHGEAPVGKMMQQTTLAHSGSYGMQLIADSAPSASMFWAGVNPTGVNAYAMQKQFDPYVSAWYYDDLSANVAGQIYAVPSWVNPYINGSEDWTDLQFGARYNVTNDYYYVAVGEGHPGWQDTRVARSKGWHQLKMQLSSADGRIHFYLDGNHVGASYRDDYTDLGSEIGLYTMFLAPLSSWNAKPYTVWDDFEYGSKVPVPGAVLLGLLGLSVAGARLRRRS